MPTEETVGKAARSQTVDIQIIDFKAHSAMTVISRVQNLGHCTDICESSFCCGMTGKAAFEIKTKRTKRFKGKLHF